MNNPVIKKKSGMQKSFFERMAPVVFLGPAVIMLVCISIIPIGYSFYLSFQSYNLAMPASTVHFVGIMNYMDMLADKNFIASIQWTLTFAVVVVAIETVLGLVIASMLNSEASFRFAAPF